MTITRESKEDPDTGKAKRLVCCDYKNCHATLDFSDHTFQEAVQGIMLARWEIKKLFSSWLHYCPQHKGPLPR